MPSPDFSNPFSGQISSFVPSVASSIANNPWQMATSAAASAVPSLIPSATAGLGSFMSNAAGYVPPATAMTGGIDQAASLYDSSQINPDMLIGGLPPTADDTGTYSGPNLSPETQNDPRFKWQAVEPVLLSYQKDDFNIREYNDGINSTGFNEMESRVYSLDMWRAGSDTPTDIGAFRVIDYQHGQINTKKQIFPRNPTLYSQQVNENRFGLQYKKMIISSMSMNYMERSQILKSNKALHAYLFNDAPEVAAIQGYLKTSSTDPWDIAMVLLWSRLFRATELIRHNGILELSIADVVYWGYPLSFSYQISSNTQFVASFAMQMLIVDKLLPLQNLDDAVMTLTTQAEQNSEFVTTSQSTTNDLATPDFFAPTNVSASSLDELDSLGSSVAFGAQTDALALGQGPLSAEAASAYSLDSLSILPQTVQPLSFNPVPQNVYAPTATIATDQTLVGAMCAPQAPPPSIFGGTP